MKNPMTPFTDALLAQPSTRSLNNALTALGEIHNQQGKPALFQNVLDKAHLLPREGALINPKHGVWVHVLATMLDHGWASLDVDYEIGLTELGATRCKELLDWLDLWETGTARARQLIDLLDKAKKENR